MVYPVSAASPISSRTLAHNFPQAPGRLGLLPGYLPHGLSNVHVMGICGTELRKARDLCSPALVSPLYPHRVSPGSIESARQAIPNNSHLQYVTSP